MSLNQPITVLCVDDHAIVREGLVSLIAGDLDLKVAGEAATAQQAINAFRACKPDVTVIDLRLPDGDGTLLTLTHEQFVDEPTREAHQAGWSGVLDKIEEMFV